MPSAHSEGHVPDFYTTTRAHRGAKPGVSPLVSSGTCGVSRGTGSPWKRVEFFRHAQGRGRRFIRRPLLCPPKGGLLFLLTEWKSLCLSKLFNRKKGRRIILQPLCFSRQRCDYCCSCRSLQQRINSSRVTREAPSFSTSVRPSIWMPYSRSITSLIRGRQNCP